MMRWSGCSPKMWRSESPTVRSLRVKPGLFGVRRVREQETDARIAVRERPDAGEVGAATIDRRVVDLEVARVDDDALGRVEGRRETVRDRVGDGDELDVERPDRAPLAVGDRDQLRRR